MNHLPSRPPPLRDFTPPPPIARPLVSDALDNSFAAGATSDALNNSFATGASTYNGSGNTGGEGGLVDLSAVETVAAAVGGGRFILLIQAMIQAMTKNLKNRCHCLGVI